LIALLNVHGPIITVSRKPGTKPIDTQLTAAGPDDDGPPTASARTLDTEALAALTARIKDWGRELGFQHVGVCDADLGPHEARLEEWLENGYHGTMDYMARHGRRRSRPAELVPGTVRVIAVRMDYLPAAARPAEELLDEPATGLVSRYALGRDYHKVLRQRLQRLRDRIAAQAGPFGYRVFVDSAPVLEKALAEKAGLGWIGKHSNLLSRRAGSWFFLGEIYTDLPLPVDRPAANHCGDCVRCIEACPTGAIVGPYRVDARRCISYLTIELRGSIPVELRPLLGNRIYGCDDCQLVCPWNRFAQYSAEADFAPRHGLDAPALAELFAWSEDEFLRRTEGSAIRRTGYRGWLRNIAVALGNVAGQVEGGEPARAAAVAALESRRDDPSELVREHVEWALKRLQ
jgi:epoxyqueuosine reductase